MLIFDIGFNKGEYSKAWMEKCPGCKIVAVDPAPLQNFPEITLYQNVISDKSGERVTFYYGTGQGSGISTASKKFMEKSRFTMGSKNLPPRTQMFNWGACNVFTTKTLDDIVATHGDPDIIKLDIEGGEYKALQGLTKASAQMICFEWSEEFMDELLKCVDYLDDLGYNKYGIIGYFDEGDEFTMARYSEQGDPRTDEPNYYSKKEILEEVVNICQPDRRVNYGMFFVRF